MVIGENKAIMSPLFYCHKCVDVGAGVMIVDACGTVSWHSAVSFSRDINQQLSLIRATRCAVKRTMCRHCNRRLHGTASF